MTTTATTTRVPLVRTPAARAALAGIWRCGDGRYRVSVGGALGYMLPGSSGTYGEAEDVLRAWLRKTTTATR